MADLVNKTNRMKVFKAQNQPFCLQNFYLPRFHDTRYDFLSIALINIAESFKVLVKIRPCDSNLPVNCAFADLSVVVPENWENFDLDSQIYCSEIAASDIRILGAVGVAECVEVLVICSSVKTVSKLKQGRFCDELVKDFLKQFVISPNCIVFGESSHEFQCHCVITKISGELCEAYRVSKRTKISVKQVLSLQMFRNFGKNSELFTELDENLTLPKVARILKHVIVKRGRFHDKNIILVGPTACGKSTLIQTVSKEIGRIVLSVSCGDLSLVSEKLKKLIETAKLHVRAQESCVLVLKDVDRVCVRRNDELTASSRQLIQEITACLLDIRHIDEIAVIATTTSPEEVDVLLKRVGVFSQEVEITMLTEIDRESVFNRLALTYGFDCDCGALVASWTPGYVLGDFHLLFREAQNFLEDYKDMVECFKKAVSLTLPSSLKGTRGLVTSHKISFQDIGGLEDVKKVLKMSVLWQMNYQEAFARFGIPPTRGILLFGPPGCAKTTLVKALACESKATFLAVSAADIYSCYVGEAEKRITKLFAQARIGAPTILFIDEIDALVGTKDGDRNHGAQERILATLLLEMDGVGLVLRASDTLTKLHENQTQKLNTSQVHVVNNSQVIVVGATNRPEMIDDALKRPGRFDKIVHVPAPNIAERFAILQQITASMALDDSVDLEYIARNTELCSGADLKSICTESALFALTTRGMDTTKIQNSDFKHVIGNFRPSLRNLKTCNYN